MKHITPVLSALLLLASSVSAAEPVRIRMASTTSTQNSGLFDHLLPLFEQRTGIRVDVVAVGTGAAIEIGKRGDADVVFVHAREQELQAVEDGFFVNRRDVMYNDFIVIGPPDDPARVRSSKRAVHAFKAIAATGAPFVSRGDRSGTHTKELSIWNRAGIDPVGKPWYLVVGQGMEKTQRIASEKRAYTLTDRGTWLATAPRDRLDMAVVLERDPALFNQYGVMAVNSEQHRHVKHREALLFVNWIVSREGQDAIRSFTDRRGNALFIPNAR